ncbi:MAG: hypothetical protein JWM43_4222 [Acidobacteriaceae bacterium]|nr:hypothetical protein [Acidobacteriaceae bacterium]
MRAFGLRCGVDGLMLLACCLLGCTLGCNSEPPKPHVSYDPGTADFYRQDVAPIFKTNCYRCHGGMNRKGEYSMQTSAGLVRGGKHGVAVIPGDPTGSLLVKLIRHEGPKDNPMPMPDKRKKLSDANIAIVERWIRAGAALPEDLPRP